VFLKEADTVQEFWLHGEEQSQHGEKTLVYFLNPHELHPFFKEEHLNLLKQGKVAWVKSTIDINEQCRFGNSIFDARITSEGMFQIIIESKLDARLTPDQLEKYVQVAQRQVNEYPEFLILAITRNYKDEQMVARINNDRVKHVMWQRLYLFLEEVATKEKDVMIYCMLQLMKERGLEPMKMNLYPNEQLKTAKDTVNHVLSQSKLFLEKVNSHVPFAHQRNDDWILQSDVIRSCFKVLTNRKAYEHDNSIVWNVVDQYVEYVFYLAVRAWDKKRSSQKAETAYLEEALTGLLSIKDEDRGAENKQTLKY
jgi:hypothetical protein